jgi:rod shape-determining protein MreD
VTQSGAARGLAPWRWLGVPTLQVMGLTFLFALPLRFWGYSLPQPVFALPVVFAWAVIRPAMLGPPAVMMLGLYQDLLWGTPTGFWAVCLLLPYGAVLAARAMLAGQSQLMMWIWYGAACALTLGAGYLFTMLDAQNAPNWPAIGWQFLATVVLYPFANRLIERFEDADVRFR